MTNPTILSNGTMIVDARRIDLTAAIDAATPDVTDLPAHLADAVDRGAISLRRARAIALNRPQQPAAAAPLKHILPDLPDRVHGIKSLTPCIVQCDGCGKTATGTKVALTILLSGIVFNELAKRPGVRQCRECWARDGQPIR